MKICVYGCPGKDGKSEPHVFYLGARRLPVIAILERWADSGHTYFDVKTDDGRCFVLRHALNSDAWELAGVYRPGRSGRARAAIRT